MGVLNKIHELSFEDAVVSLRDTYKALDIRALLIKEATEWICIFLVIRNTAADTNQLICKYKNKDNQVKIPNLDNLKVILESRQIDKIDSLINDIKNGFFTFGQIKAKLVNTNCKVLEKGTVKVESTYSNNGYPTVALLYSNSESKSPLGALTDHRINAKNLELSELTDIRIWFDLDLSNTTDFIWIFPIYSKITSKHLEDKKVIFKSSIHKKILSDSKINMEYRSPEGYLLSYLRHTRVVEKEHENGIVDISLDAEITNFEKRHSIILIIDNDKLGQISVDNLVNSAANERNKIPEYSFDVKQIPIMSNMQESFDIAFLNFLKQNGIIYDNFNQRYYLNSQQRARIFPDNRNDIIKILFNDPFYDNLTFEINFSWKLGLFTSTLVLTRKMVENLLIDILRMKFPVKNEPSNLELYYNKNEGRFNDLSVLLKNLKNKKNEFVPDEKEINAFLSYVEHFREKANSNAHSIIEFSSEEDIEKFNIAYIIGFLKRILDRL